MNIALIVPSFNHFSYVLKTVKSFFEHTPGDNNKCLVIDDASSSWSKIDWAAWPPHVLVPSNMHSVDLLAATHQEIDPRASGTEKILCYHFTKHYGLTRSWNMGLRISGRSQPWAADITVCGNSDILFTPGWSAPLVKALEEYDLIGPITNAPGRVVRQNVKRHLSKYQLTDDPAYLAKVATQLCKTESERPHRSLRINGFFMMAKTKTWWDGAFNENYVFNPAERMDQGAYELQGRWRRRRKKIGFVSQSFIFHYRSISRGPRGLRGEFGRGAWRPKPL